MGNATWWLCYISMNELGVHVIFCFYYNFQQQMYTSNNNIIDSVSANELLKALNTLTHLHQPHPTNTNQPHNNTSTHQPPSHIDISFSDHPNNITLQSELKTTSNVIDFDLYMQKKKNNKTIKPHQHTLRKSISPFKQNRPQHDHTNLRNLKSRSHSPLIKKAERSMMGVQLHVGKQPLKQIKKENIPKHSQINYQASFQSKKILDKKQKKGFAYVPIQFRTEELLKEKQIKLAKLQKQKQISQILKEKEYTFKPNLTKNGKKIKAESKYMQNNENKAPINETIKKSKAANADYVSNQLTEEEKQFKSIDFYVEGKKERQSRNSDVNVMQPILQETIRYDSRCQENEFLATQPIQLKHEQQSTEYLFPNYKADQLKPKKYKNQKFNFLLDLIH